MNERFAAEPTTCDSANDLKHLLEKFGPVTGRYLAKFPASSWESLLRSHIEPWKDVEREKALLCKRPAAPPLTRQPRSGCPFRSEVASGAATVPQAGC